MRWFGEIANEAGCKKTKSILQEPRVFLEEEAIRSQYRFSPPYFSLLFPEQTILQDYFH